MHNYLDVINANISWHSQQNKDWNGGKDPFYCFFVVVVVVAQKNFISGPKSRRMLNLELSLFDTGLDFPVTAIRVEVMSAQPQP